MLTNAYIRGTVGTPWVVVRSVSRREDRLDFREKGLYVTYASPSFSRKMPMTTVIGARGPPPGLRGSLTTTVHSGAHWIAQAGQPGGCHGSGKPVDAAVQPEIRHRGRRFSSRADRGKPRPNAVGQVRDAADPEP